MAGDGGLSALTAMQPFGGRTYFQKLIGSSPTCLWTFGDAAKPVLASSVENTVASEELFANTGFEIDGSTFGRNFGAWQERVGTGTITDELVIVHSGGHALKFTRGADNNTWVYQDVKVTPGDTLSLTMWARGDGVVGGRYAIYDLTNAAWIQGFTATGVTGVVYTQVAAPAATVPATCGIVRVYLSCPTAAGSCYFDDVGLAGYGCLDGAYSGAGVTVGHPGIGDGNTSAYFTGAVTASMVGSNRFTAVWNGNCGSAIAWGKMSAAQWADVAEYRYLFHIRAADDAHYYVVFGKANVASRLVWRRKAGNLKDVNEQVYTFGAAPADQWFCQGYTWDTSVPNLRGYLYVPGVLDFTEVFDVPGNDMDPWVGSPNDVNAVLSAGNLEAQEWTGYEAYCVVWAGVAHSALKMQSLMKV